WGARGEILSSPESFLTRVQRIPRPLRHRRARCAALERQQAIMRHLRRPELFQRFLWLRLSRRPQFHQRKLAQFYLGPHRREDKTLFHTNTSNLLWVFPLQTSRISSGPASRLERKGQALRGALLRRSARQFCHWGSFCACSRSMAGRLRALYVA